MLFARALRRKRRFRDRLDPLSIGDNELINHKKVPGSELVQLIEGWSLELGAAGVLSLTDYTRTTPVAGNVLPIDFNVLFISLITVSVAKYSLLIFEQQSKRE